jgi:hypothetical protein
MSPLPQRAKGAPHRLGPPPPQTCPSGQSRPASSAPQKAVSAQQPSLCGPQVPAGYDAQVFGTQLAIGPVPQSDGPPPPQCSMAPHVTHVAMNPPHPSLTGQHPAEGRPPHPCGMQVMSPTGCPHHPGPPPPQYSGATQVPQLAVSPPHPSLWVPQVPLRKSVQVLGKQGGGPASGGGATSPPHLLKPPPPQYCPPSHAPQSMRPPHVSPFVPHSYPSDRQVFGTQTAPLLPEELPPLPEVEPPLPEPLDPLLESKPLSDSEPDSAPSFDPELPPDAELLAVVASLPLLEPELIADPDPLPDGESLTP